MASISIPRQDAAQPAESGLKWRIAEACERAAAFACAAAAGPIVIISALSVALLSRKTPFIAHRRVGWRGRTLWMLKLRTMWGAESAAGRRNGLVEYIDDAAGPEMKQASDPRITSRFARFCRRHSIDEIPQLWHVIRGEMSLVGPRPMTHDEILRYYGADAAEVLEAKPGIAGLWQVSGRNRLTYEERRRLDLELVRRRSPWLYLAILFRTIPEVFSGNHTY